MAQPLRDRLMAVPFHSGPSAENTEYNSIGKRRNFLASLRVSRGDERRFGGFDDFSECMKTNVLVLDGTSKLFLVMCVLYCPLNFWMFVEHCQPSILQRIEPSSSPHFLRDIHAHSLVTLLRDVRLASAAMGLD